MTFAHPAQGLFDDVRWQDIALILTIALITRWIYYNFIQPFLSPLRKLPGKPYRPFVGNMFEAHHTEAMTNAIKWLTDCKCLTIRYYHFWGKERLLTADPKVFRHILVTNERNYTRVTPGNSPIMKMMGKALFFLSGSVHHSMRKLLNPAFNMKVLENMLPIFESKARDVVKIWNYKLQSTDGANIPVQDFMTRITLDTICDTGLDYQLNAVTDPNTAGVQIFTKYLQQVGAGNLLATLIPFYYSMPWFKENHTRWTEELHLRSIINERITSKKRYCKNIKPDQVANIKDFLGLLVMARDEAGKPIPDDLLFENVAGLMFAGFDTTSITLTWVMLHLASYPDIQNRTRQEIMDVCPNDLRDFTHEDLDKLQYLNCVIKETQRLYPVVSSTTRQAIREDVVNGIKIPAGTKIVLHLGALHRMEENWKEPEKFKPERFQEETELYKHLPFIAGPQMCIGHKFAMLEMKIVLATLLRQFKFSLVPGYRFKRIQALSVKPHPPLELMVQKL